VPAKKGKAYRELFQLLLAHINGTADTEEPAVDDDLLDDEDEA
jgi:ribosome-associated protein